MQTGFTSGKTATVAMALMLAGLAVSDLPARAGQPIVETSAGTADDAPTMEYKLAVEAAAQAWLDALGEKVLKIETEPLEARYELYALSPPSTVLTSEDDGWNIYMGLTEEISSSMSAQDVQRRIKTFSLNGFPIPGLEAPHWLVEAVPPSSDMDEDVEVLEVGPGRIKLRVRTEFFALYGEDTRAEYIADASTPEEAYFQITKKFAGDAILNLSIKGF